MFLLLGASFHFHHSVIGMTADMRNSHSRFSDLLEFLRVGAVKWQVEAGFPQVPPQCGLLHP